jgi:hypothetical protein
LYLSNQANGTVWCLPILGLTNTRQLMVYFYNGTTFSLLGPIVPLNSWTHTALTYSRANGLRLYVNGTSSNSAAPFAYVSGGQPMHLFISTPLSGISCAGGYNTGGPYSGAVDELRVYSRELSGGDVAALANP